MPFYGAAATDPPHLDAEAPGGDLPAWSIHSACATHNYTFIWGMAGENLDYGDMDTCAVTDLK